MQHIHAGADIVRIVGPYDGFCEAPGAGPIEIAIHVYVTKKTVQNKCCSPPAIGKLNLPRFIARGAFRTQNRRRVARSFSWLHCAGLENAFELLLFHSISAQDS
jgi:hypothetical protein